MQFGLYLADNGVISAEEFLELAKLQLHSRPPFGAVAVQLRKLNCRQVFSILRAQVDGSAELFGQTAQRLGYLSEEDVARIVAEQTKRATPMRNLLTEHRFLDEETVRYHYQQFIECLCRSEEPTLATC